MSKIMAGARMKHRPEEGGYVRGDETRQLLLTTAIAVFGDRGFDGASTRMLVEPCGASPAAIQYYFGGKAGLYRACAEYLADHAWRKIEADARVFDRLSLEADQDVLINALCDFFFAQEKTLHLDEEMSQKSLFLMREQMSTGEVFDIIFERLNLRVLQKFSPFIGAIIGKPADDPETQLRTSMILSLMTGLRGHGQVTLQFMGWTDFTGDRLVLWQAIMRANLRAMLLASIE